MFVATLDYASWWLSTLVPANFGSMPAPQRHALIITLQPWRDKGGVAHVHVHHTHCRLVEHSRERDMNLRKGTFEALKQPQRQISSMSTPAIAAIVCHGRMASVSQPVAPHVVARRDVMNTMYSVLRNP